jgi:hypothetical protein
MGSGSAVHLDQYARCNDCGGEVVFDAWATLRGEVWNQFEKSNICTACDGRDVQWTEAARENAAPTEGEGDD